jgi:hypothetical protein
MTPEERKMLEETRSIVEDNRRILRSLQKSNRYKTILRVLYWFVIIALSFGSYYFIQPYIETLKSSLNDITGSSSTEGASLFDELIRS